VDDLHDTDTAADRAETERAIAAKRRELDRNAEIIQRMESVDQEALESFRRTARKTGDEIRALEAHLAELPDEEADAVSAQELHAMLAQTEIADIIARAWVDGDVAALRELLAATVESARIVQRVPTGTGPDRRKRWMRAEVTWTRAVDLFRKHGRLVLGPAPEPPPAQALTPRQRAAERARRYRQRKREQRAADSG
jgi:hypothetical protein